MIGVVLWSNVERQKAVIWCEDHQALAYLDRSEDLRDGITWPGIGDLVELESETIGSLRRARQVSRLDDRICPEIPAMLKDGKPVPHLRLVSSQPSVLREEPATAVPERISASR